MLKKYMNVLYRDSERINELNIAYRLSLHSNDFKNIPTKLLDVGCWDGVKTLKWSKAAKAEETYGFEQDASAAAAASSLGIHISIGSADETCRYHDRELYGFRYESVSGSGLHPFPAVLGKYVVPYCAFITLTFIKR